MAATKNVCSSGGSPWRRATRTGLVLVAILMPAGGWASALAGDLALETIALAGDPAPGGGTFGSVLRRVSVDDLGRVVFVADADDPPAFDSRIFAYQAGVGSVVAGEGDAAPVSGGGSYTDFGHTESASFEYTAFAAAYDDGSISKVGAFARSGPTQSPLVLPGDPAPQGGTMERIDFVHDVAGANDVAFSGRVDVGGPASLPAHFVAGPAGVSEVVRQGQLAPLAVGGTFDPLDDGGRTALAADGSLAFVSALSGGVASQGLFLWTGATISALRLTGDALSSSPGGTYELFHPSLAVSTTGDIVLYANVLRPGEAFALDGIYVLTPGGGEREVIYHGDPIPATSPQAYFGGVAGSPPPADINGAGDVVFTAVLEDGVGNAIGEALLASTSEGVRVIARSGDPVPSRPGEIFSGFTEARINEDGHVAIAAWTTAGQGIFGAVPAAGVPALEGGHAILAALLLAGLGTLLLLRIRPARA